MSLVELSISSVLVALTLAVSGWVIHAEWDRAKCAYVVFEQTHARLSGSQAGRPPISIRFDEDSGSIGGTARCGRAEESVRLYKLEAAPW